MSKTEPRKKRVSKRGDVNSRHGLKRMTEFLFEVGTMRKVARMHRQVLFTDDMSDNIATHSFRVVFIGYMLAKLEGVDPLKVMMMCLLHDTGESRSNDHNWVNKKYVHEDEEAILEDQLASLPFLEFANIVREYQERKTPESIVAKDADVLDEVLLLREYAWQGNREAAWWLRGKRRPRPYAYLSYVKTRSAKALGRVMYKQDPSSWWRYIYTNKRRAK